MLVVLIACALPPPLLISDADDDGYVAGRGDCDDHDEDVNPEAVEACNGVDDDCDGAVDAGACDAWSPYEDVPSVIGESGLGTVLRAGLFDGDAVDDLLATATIGNSPAVCILGGTRVGAGVDQTLSSVANCWVTTPSLVGPVVISADRLGVALPVGQDVAVVGSGQNLCVLDPASPAYTVDEAAYGCFDTTQLPSEIQTGLQLTPADVDRGTLAGASGVYLGIIDPVDYLRGAPPQPVVVEFVARVDAVENVGDVDGDGMEEIGVAVDRRAYLVRGDSDVTGPVELITPYFVDARAAVTAVRALGDVDGDGTGEWMTMGASGTEIWSLTTAFARVTDALVSDPAGDFNGDGLADLWTAYTASGGELEGRRLVLGGAWASEVTAEQSADLTLAETGGGFGAAVAAAPDRTPDAYADVWMSAPSYSEEDLRGRLYLVEGWGLDRRE